MKELFFQNFNKKWVVFVSLSFIIFGLIGYVIYQIRLFSSAYSYIVLFGFIGTLLAAGLFVLHLYVKRIENSLEETAIELQATHGINKLTKTPLNLGDWAITAIFLNRLVEEIYTRKPKLVLECGSGTSTLVAASCLKKIGQGKILSLDHSDEYAQKTRQLLELEGLSNWATVVTAPLKEYNLEIGSFQWYNDDFMRSIDRKIDLLIVDGPPGYLQKLSRYPAVPLLKELFAEECSIMLDDTNRKDEKEIVQKWNNILTADIEFNRFGIGFCLITKKN